MFPLRPLTFLLLQEFLQLGLLLSLPFPCCLGLQHDSHESFFTQFSKGMLTKSSSKKRKKKKKDRLLFNLLTFHSSFFWHSGKKKKSHIQTKRPAKTDLRGSGHFITRRAVVWIQKRRIREMPTVLSSWPRAWGPGNWDPPGPCRHLMSLSRLQAQGCTPKNAQSLIFISFTSSLLIKKKKKQEHKNTLEIHKHKAVSHECAKAGESEIQGAWISVTSPGERCWILLQARGSREDIWQDQEGEAGNHDNWSFLGIRQLKWLLKHRPHDHHHHFPLGTALCQSCHGQKDTGT